MILALELETSLNFGSQNENLEKKTKNFEEKMNLQENNGAIFFNF